MFRFTFVGTDDDFLFFKLEFKLLDLIKKWFFCFWWLIFLCKSNTLQLLDLNSLRFHSLFQLSNLSSCSIQSPCPKQLIRRCNQRSFFNFKHQSWILFLQSLSLSLQSLNLFNQFICIIRCLVSTFIGFNDWLTIEL